MVKNSNNGSSVGVAERIQSNKPKTMAGKRKQYKGVRMRSWGSWVSEIRAPNQKTRIWLGSYATPEAAARAYDAALLCLKGSSADLNFPTTPSTHFTHTVMSPKSIQRTAAAAANGSIYPPSSSSSSFPSSPSSYDCRDVSTPCSGNYSATKMEEDLQSSTPPPPSPSDHQGDISMPCCGNHTASRIEDSCCSVDPWIDFEELQSPKCVDQVPNDCNSLFLDPPVMYECEDEDDIHLWSFC